MVDYETRYFDIKEIWNWGEFNRSDGSKSSYQTIRNEDDYSLTVWGKQDLKSSLKTGDRIKVTDVYKKKNDKDYWQWNTGKNSVITKDTTKINTLTGKPMNAEPKVAGMKKTKEELPLEALVMTQYLRILDRLDEMNKKLDNLAEMM